MACLLQGCRGQSNNDKTIRLAFISNNNEQFWQFAQRGTEKAAKDQVIATRRAFLVEEAESNAIDAVINAVEVCHDDQANYLDGRGADPERKS